MQKKKPNYTDLDLETNPDVKDYHEEPELSSQTNTEDIATEIKSKVLVTNQVMIENEVKFQRKEAIREYGLAADAFRFEPVIFVPKIQTIVQNMELTDDMISEPGSVRIPINCIHSDEGLLNNTEEIKMELRDLQLQYSRQQGDPPLQQEGKVEEKYEDEENDKNEDKVGDEVKEGVCEEEGSKTEQRSLRFKQKTNYGESALDDLTFQFLISKQKLPTAPAVPVKVPAKEEGSLDSKGRNRLSEEETTLLDKWFDKNPYPNLEERTTICNSMKIPEKKVRIWFQNKRCKTDEGKMKCFFARNNIQNSDSGEDEGDLQELNLLTFIII